MKRIALENAIFFVLVLALIGSVACWAPEPIDYGEPSKLIGQEIADLKSEIAELRWQLDGTRRHQGIMINSTKDMIFHIIDADLDAIEQGRAKEVIGGYVTDGFEYVMSNAGILGATKAEIQARVDRRARLLSVLK